MNFLKKITTRDCGLDVTTLSDVAAAKGKKADIAVLRIAGTIDKAESLSSQYGPYIKFFGQFEAHNLLNDSVFRSRALIVPAVAEAAIEGMYNAGSQGGDQTVTVAFDITVKYYENPNKQGTKFRFSVAPLIEPKEDDVIARLMKSLPKAKALPNGGK